MKNEPPFLLNLPDTEKKAIIDDLIYFFESERGETIGVIAADEILTKVLDLAAPHFYNKGIEDASKLVADHNDRIDSDLAALRKVT